MAGADVVLGMIPFARELLRMGAEVVMCANSQPAINDITAPELRALLDQIAAVCPVIKVRAYAFRKKRFRPMLHGMEQVVLGHHHPPPCRASILLHRLAPNNKRNATKCKCLPDEVS